MPENTSILANAEPVVAIPNIELANNLEEEARPPMDDPKWSEYVIKQLEPDEMYNGLPTTDGLRRMASKLLGPIVYSAPTYIEPPKPENDNHATVRWEIHILWDGRYDDKRIFGDVSDTYRDNTPEAYAIHAPATAATKAEGRALRKALQLRKVISAEEISSVPITEQTNISSGQIAFIGMMCERLNINVLKLIQQSKEKKYQRIEEVPNTTAVKIVQYLNQCQKDSSKIPDGVVGYDENWRNNESTN